MTGRVCAPPLPPSATGRGVGRRGGLAGRGPALARWGLADAQRQRSRRCPRLAVCREGRPCPHAEADRLRGSASAQLLGGGPLESPNRQGSLSSKSMGSGSTGDRGADTPIRMTSRRRWGRLLLITGGSSILALIAFIVVAPALLRPGANRLPIFQTPRDYGVAFETVEFQPPDKAITLRAWWMPVARPKAAIILVHGGGDDNRALPYADGLKLARDLIAHNYAVLAVDLRKLRGVGCGAGGCQVRGGRVERCERCDELLGL